MKKQLLFILAMVGSLVANDFQRIDLAAGKDRLMDIVSFNNGFIILGDQHVYRSENGLKWKKRKLQGIREPLHMEASYIHKNDLVSAESWGLIIACKNGDLHCSTDGITWKLYHKGNGSAVKKVYEAEFSPWGYMMFGEAGAVYTCAVDEGYTEGWKYGWLGTRSRINEAVFAKDCWTAVGDHGTVLRLSPDTTGTQNVYAQELNHRINVDLNDIIECDGRFYAVGDSGYIGMWSRDDRSNEYRFGEGARLKAVACNHASVVVIDSVRVYRGECSTWDYANQCMGAQVDSAGKAELLSALWPLREDEGALREDDRKPVTVDFNSIKRPGTPILPGSGGCLDDFVPPGWEILCADTGKLDHNATDDIVFVIQSLTPSEAEYDEDFQDTFAVYSRMLGVLYGFTDNGRPDYNLVQCNSAVPVRDSRFIEEPFNGLGISGDTLKIHTGYFANAGTWYMSGSTFNFRCCVQNNVWGLHLVSVETNTYKRNTGESWDVFINLSQKSMQVTHTAFQEKPGEASDAAAESKDASADSTRTEYLELENLPSTLIEKFNPWDWTGMGT